MNRRFEVTDLLLLKPKQFLLVRHQAVTKLFRAGLLWVNQVNYFVPFFNKSTLILMICI
jgi:hypothetical protein